MRTLSHSQIQEITREAFRHTNQLTRCFQVYAATKRVLVKVHEVMIQLKVTNPLVSRCLVKKTVEIILHTEFKAESSLHFEYITTKHDCK